MIKDILMQHMVDGERLRHIAHRDFIRAMRTGRMMAFVGSYTGPEFGYAGWDDFLKAVVPGTKIPIADFCFPVDVIQRWSADNKNFDDVKNAAYEELTSKGGNSLLALDLLNLMEKRRAKKSRDAYAAEYGISDGKRSTPNYNSIWQICRNLGIRRIITTNYDMEFEFELMANPHLAMDAAARSKLRGDTARNWKTERTAARSNLVGADGLPRRIDYRIKHNMPDSRIVLSDCFHRERADRLFEFSVGASDRAWHIMHLHGRVTDKETMIVDYSDYERQYRTRGISRLPFQHGMNLLYAGNPILFIGLGMSEDDVLGALRMFVGEGYPSNLAPHFVLWSPDSAVGRKVSAKDELRRLKFYRQYGVHLLYDVEITVGDGTAQTLASTKRPNRLKASIAALAEFAANKVLPFEWEDGRYEARKKLSTGGDFRDLQGFLKRQERKVGPSVIWEIKPKNGANQTPLNTQGIANATAVVNASEPIKAFIDPPGSGHGYAAKFIRDHYRSNSEKGRYLQLNAAFAWEMDTCFAAASGLADRVTAFRKRKSRLQVAQELFKSIADTNYNGPALCLAINGADRFFDPTGYPLSNELDQLIRMVVALDGTLTAKAASNAATNVKATPGQEKKSEATHGEADAVLESKKEPELQSPKVTIMLFGTARVERYLLSLFKEYPTVNATPSFSVASRKPPPWLAQWSVRIEGQGAGAFPEFHLIDSAKKAPDQLWDNLDFDREALRGKMPKLPSVYFGQVKAAYEAGFTWDGGEAAQGKINWAEHTAIRQSLVSPEVDLRKSFLTAVLEPHNMAAALQLPNDSQRIDVELVLRTLKAMALIGQPVDTEILETVVMENGSERAKRKFSEKLRKLHEADIIMEFEHFPGVKTTAKRYGLHRALLHEIRDRNSVPFSDARNYTSFNIPLATAQPIDDHEPDMAVQTDIEEIIDSLLNAAGVALFKAEKDGSLTSETMDRVSRHLRAATASVRSYYTTSTLLMHEPEAFPSEKKSPKMLAHAERLNRLIYLGERQTDLWRKRQGGPDDVVPTYLPDDLVWLHAQRGVALMTQGDLYGARDSLGKATVINDRFVEFGDRSQNWRRIELNQIHIDIERGKISNAEARIRNLKASVNNLTPDANWRGSWYERTGDKYPQNAFEAIMQAYGIEQRPRVRAVSPHFAADLILTVGLSCGYRGWCEYLRGRLRTAEHYFKICIQIMRNTGEQRAYALFLRHYASLLNAMGQKAESRDAMNLCLAAAESTRQLDIAHLAAINKAEHDIESGEPVDRVAILRETMNSLRYAVLTDMYRVRMEARRVLAQMRLQDGDFDGALEQATDAMAIASRFGFSLRKVDLRILIGQILRRRGDPVSGDALFQEAGRIADRVGYQRAVEKVHHAQIHPRKSRI